MKRRQWCQMEIQQAVRKVEALVKEKGNRFAALEWVGVQKGKMEVMVMDKVVAEIHVRAATIKHSGTRRLLWLPPLV